MPVLTFTKSAAHGPLVKVTLQPSLAGAKTLSRLNLPTVTPITVDMLLDTGADSTFVDEDLISPWNLPYANYGTARSINGAARVMVYELSLHVHGSKGQLPWHSPAVMVHAMGNQPFAGQPYVGLVGRDMLDRTVFIYNGPCSECTLAYWQ